MLLFALAMDNETVPTELCDTCNRVITVALTKQEINIQFEAAGMNDISFPPGYSTSMYNGTLLWSSQDTPSNHSPFSFNQKTRHLMLQLILTQSRGMTVDEVKASNKQEVNTPSNFNNMKEQLRMFSVANNIFLSPLIIGSCTLRSLQTTIENNRSTLKAREQLDE